MAGWSTVSRGEGEGSAQSDRQTLAGPMKTCDLILSEMGNHWRVLGKIGF